MRLKNDGSQTKCADGTNNHGICDINPTPNNEIKNGCRAAHRNGLQDYLYQGWLLNT